MDNLTAVMASIACGGLQSDARDLGAVQVRLAFADQAYIWVHCRVAFEWETVDGAVGVSQSGKRPLLVVAFQTCQGMSFLYSPQ